MGRCARRLRRCLRPQNCRQIQPAPSVKTLCTVPRMHDESFEFIMINLLSYLDITAFTQKRVRAFWSASLVAQPLYNTTYALPMEVTLYACK